MLSCFCFLLSPAMLAQHQLCEAIGCTSSATCSGVSSTPAASSQGNGRSSNQEDAWDIASNPCFSTTFIRGTREWPCPQQPQSCLWQPGETAAQPTETDQTSSSSQRKQHWADQEKLCWCQLDPGRRRHSETTDPGDHVCHCPTYSRSKCIITWSWVLV